MLLSLGQPRLELWRLDVLLWGLGPERLLLLWSLWRHGLHMQRGLWHEWHHVVIWSS